MVLLKQCCILISNLPSGFVFNQKDELPSICKLYKLIIFSKKMNQRIGLLNIPFLTLNARKSQVQCQDCAYSEDVRHLCNKVEPKSTKRKLAQKFSG